MSALLAIVVTFSFVIFCVVGFMTHYIHNMYLYVFAVMCVCIRVYLRVQITKLSWTKEGDY